jgi:uncharacterized phage protein (TIGR02218 family)
VSLLTSLVAHWPLDEASGTRYDAHASYDLGEVSGVDRAAGKIGYAAEFLDGEAGYLRLSGIDGTDLGLGDTDFTVALWAKVGARGGLLCQWVDSGLYLYTATGGALVVGCGGSEYSGATFPLNEWQLVILDFRASDNRLRLHQDSTSSWTVTAPGTGTEVVLGDNVGTTGDRWLDSVSVWLRILSDAERAALYNSGSGLDYPDFDAPVLLAGTVAGVATLTGGLSVAQALAGSVSGTATLNGGLTVTRALAGTVSGVATLTGGLSVTRALAGTVAGTATLQGDLSGSVLLSGDVTGTGSLSGDLHVTKPLAGEVSGQATLSGDIEVSHLLSGTVVGTGALAAALTQTVQLGGTVAGTSSLSADLETTSSLAGVIQASGAVTATLSVTISLAGEVSAEATLAAELTVNQLQELAGAVTASALLSGSLTVTHSLAGTIAGAATLAAALADPQLINVMPLWSGEITSVAFDGPFIRAVAKGRYALFDQPLPRFVIQPQCNHSLFDGRCGLSQSAWTFTAAVASASGHSVTLDTWARPGGLPTGWGFAQYFALGYVERASGERLPILSSTALASGAVTLTLDRAPAATLPAAEAVSVLPGCDGRRETCQPYHATDNPEGKFNNYVRFGGCPYVPAKNPAFTPPKRTASTAGKK